MHGVALQNASSQIHSMKLIGYRFKTDKRKYYFIQRAVDSLTDRYVDGFWFKWI